MVLKAWRKGLVVMVTFRLYVALSKMVRKDRAGSVFKKEAAAGMIILDSRGVHA